jgi:hypothetical protein
VEAGSDAFKFLKREHVESVASTVPVDAERSKTVILTHVYQVLLVSQRPQETKTTDPLKVRLTVGIISMCSSQSTGLA